MSHSTQHMVVLLCLARTRVAHFLAPSSSVMLRALRNSRVMRWRTIPWSGVLVSLALLSFEGCHPKSEPPSCPTGNEGCACTESGTCDEELLCDLEQLTCRERQQCRDLDCAAHQVCEGSETLDAVCLEECEVGYHWDPDEEECVAEPPSCNRELDNEIVSECEDQHRLCVSSVAGAVCGACEDGYSEENGECRMLVACDDLECDSLRRECVEKGKRRDAVCGECAPGTVDVDNLCLAVTCGPRVGLDEQLADCNSEHRLCEDDAADPCTECVEGYREEAGSCRAVKTCKDLGCAARDRLCESFGAHEDARCQGCRTGFVEVSGECVARPEANCTDGDDDSILAGCGEEFRECVGQGQTGGSCGDCVFGYVWDEAQGACVERVTCADLECESENRTCEEEPNGHCGGCELGFVDDPQNGGCREAVSCDDLECSSGSRCVGGAGVDAHCVMDCGQDGIWNGLRCEPCPPCDGEGEEGRFAFSTRAGACICKTSPGYFYYTGGDIGTQQCDSDGDGWLRESARPGMESKDPAISENARCELRTIDAFVLVNEAEQEHREDLRDPLTLYESDRNDDGTIFAAKWQAMGLPPSYGDGRLPETAELNRLTKFCHALRADYNDNGVFDVEEYGSQSTPSLRADQAPFNQFSYYAELHRGYFVPEQDDEQHGHYRIEERSRGEPGEPLDVPLTYAPPDPETWRTCERGQDVNAASMDLLPVGLDFTDFHAPPSDPFQVPEDAWRGMNHHSQFQCVVLNNDPSDTIATVKTPQGVVTEGLRLNTCELSGEGIELDEDRDNALQAPLACSHLPTTDDAVTAGAVFWAAVPFLDHGLGLIPGEATYQRGCRNGCFAKLADCPGFSTNPASVECDYDATDFGSFVSCDVAEICDGIDNDEDPGTVDGSDDPLLGTSCIPTGQKGECLSGGGTWVCNPAPDFRTCVPLVSPVGEMCNGLDDNCDGEVDDGNPGADGGACTPNDAELEAAGIAPEQRNGRCLEGARADCVEGRNTCVPTTTPSAEACGNGLDDDCDGTEDESELKTPGGLERLAEYGVNQQPGCVTHYKDTDGDKYGDDLYPLCLCVEPGDPSIVSVTERDPVSGTESQQEYSSDGADCCDAVSSVYPGAGGWLSSGNNACPLPYDKNCDGQESKEYSNIVTGGCGVASIDSCSVPAVGWVQGDVFVVPGCGQSGSFYYSYPGGGCNNDGARICEQEDRNQTQRCR